MEPAIDLTDSHVEERHTTNGNAFSFEYVHAAELLPQDAEELSHENGRAVDANDIVTVPVPILDFLLALNG